MYKVSFTDRSVILCTTEQGDKIKEAQMQAKPPVYVDIDQNQYKLAGISKIEYLPEEKMVKALPERRGCHGEKSIHREIYYLYKKELATKQNPRKWEEFRSKAYDYLYTQKDEWCDGKKGTCFCTKDTHVERVIEVFGSGVKQIEA